MLPFREAEGGDEEKFKIEYVEALYGTPPRRER
jgi:hypothetical protein